ncbi:phage gp6-like head-tail connector protein [Sphingomonas koreensis]|uniref:Phage gp6-like head-tail connector protein n=1 Tax=Sphingomonas koreensis TaxID=93064 RepID=A0A1L6J7Y5_9SPHN|nr:head-tail connector protein [Sphingomonas koreensis]APR51994.1 hypothetical protein BRX40_05675 [Sphingomonas koreensis]RSU22796.1 phage gp6-like head-tail connector protein [Sphingomonas koreensis]RSU30730.1 phage gp6-like head-tail connector protein [Sphingomonas koreensis]RSU31825.1 phage gp6-like head-tail connector protein [Sphingomonas koreensis]RSU39254.1 phage gp6-like head-tail connector protein [Sphingomonas koreensis]
MRVVVVTPPIDPVVTLDIAKQHLRIDGNDDDALISAMVAAVTNHLDGPEGWLGRALGVQELEARFDKTSFGRYVRLPFEPVLELTAVEYLDGGDVIVQADLADFELLGAKLVPADTVFPWEVGSWRREAVRVRYRAGYETLPAAINAAILLMVGDLYANRESVITGPSAAAIAIPMSTTVEALLTPFRVFR